VIVTRTLRFKALLDRCIYAGLFLGGFWLMHHLSPDCGPWNMDLSCLANIDKSCVRPGKRSAVADIILSNCFAPGDRNNSPSHAFIRPSCDFEHLTWGQMAPVGILHRSSYTTSLAPLVGGVINTL
jgi:hypothetical protein